MKPKNLQRQLITRGHSPDNLMEVGEQTPNRFIRRKLAAMERKKFTIQSHTRDVGRTFDKKKRIIN